MNMFYISIHICKCADAVYKFQVLNVIVILLDITKTLTLLLSNCISTETFCLSCKRIVLL